MQDPSQPAAETVAEMDVRARPLAEGERDTAPPPPVSRRLRASEVILCIAVASAGGFLGIVGAMFQELRGGGLLVLFVGAPVIEEALKPSGVYILLVKWPHLVRNQLWTASLCALAGLIFGVLESSLYVYVYHPENETAFVVFRYTVDVAAHTVFSFIVGLGVNQKVVQSAQGTIPFLEGSRRYYLAGIILHSAFNIAVTVLTWRGLLEF